MGRSWLVDFFLIKSTGHLPATLWGSSTPGVLCLHQEEQGGMQVWGRLDSRAAARKPTQRTEVSADLHPHPAPTPTSLGIDHC